MNGSGVTVTRALTTSAALRGCVEHRGGHLRHLAGLLRRLAGERGEGVVLLVGEAGELAEAAGELDRVLVVLAAEPTEVEDRVDRALELERTLAALRVLLGEAAQPVRAHLHVGDLVGEHPVLAELEHRVARLGAELLHGAEDVDREALEHAVHAAEAQHRVGVARGGEQEGRLGVLTDLGAHVVNSS